MKCSQLDTRELAKAFDKARVDAKGGAVDMEHLAPHLAATGSSCGACPALLALAKKAFEKHGAEFGEALDGTRSALDEAGVPRPDAFVPKGA